MQINGRILGFDIGDRRIGVALSDGLQLTAQPFAVWDRKQSPPAAKRLETLLAEYPVGAILFGLPRNTDGTLGKQAEKTIQFMEKVVARQWPDIPCYAWDERFSTQGAQRALDDSTFNWKKKAAVIDKVAASFILQGFLDCLKGGNKKLTPYDFSPPCV